MSRIFIGIVITCGVMGCTGGTVFDREAADAGTPGEDTAPRPDIVIPDLECVEDGDCEGKLVCCDGTCTVEVVCQQESVCQAQGDPCRVPAGASYEAQGDFICAAVNTEGPRCMLSCDDTFAISGCPRGSYCLEINTGEVSLPVCLPGECTRSEDCADETCVPFGNEAGFCFASGDAGRGEPCGGDIRCDIDLYCLRGSEGSTCQPLCDMWTGDGAECPRGSTCGYLTLGTGVCRPQTDTGRDIGESCSARGAWCGPGIQCFDFRTGGEPLPVCTAWCRPSYDDCRGRFQNHNGFCRTVFTSGDGSAVMDFGLCL